MKYKNFLISYYSIIIVLLAFMFLNSSCYKLTKDQDPVLTGLYVIKHEWMAIREYVITKNIQGNLSNEDLEKFKATDAMFKNLYDVSVLLAIRNDTGSGILELNIKEMRNMVLKAREKFYKVD